ncbi:MAG TPA: tetratricopeptide repeat protein [Pirellulales bacterium]|nr:tetratricopeptide repeat protein [Pirellulales bacterium]
MPTPFSVLFTVGLFALSALFSPVAVAAENEGQPDLDKAIETKVSAETLAEWGTVIDLCQSALDKGLDKANEEFCKQLLSSTLLQRAEEISERLFNKNNPFGPQAPNFVRMALKDVERAVEIDPKQASAQVLLGKLQGRSGDLKKARLAFDEAVRLAKDDDDVKAQAFRWRGLISEKLDDRLDDLSEAVKLAPDNAEILRDRGAAYLAAGKPEEALADFDAALKIDDDDVAAHEARGMALDSLKRYEDAAESFGRAVELSPGNAILLLQRARMRALTGNHEGAIDDVDRALEIDPDNLFGLLLRAQTLVQLDKAEEALADANRALASRPDSDDALRVWAMVTEKADKAEEAIKELRQQVEANPDDAVAWLQLGLLYAAGKQSAKAIDADSAAIKLDPQRDFAYQVRADIYLNGGQQKEAIGDYEKALKLDAERNNGMATNNGILNNLAWVLATSPEKELRDGQRAIKLATQACELTNYKMAHILSTLAAAYAETGDFETARKWSAKSVEIADDSLKDQLRKELASYEKEQPWREKQPQP